MNVEPTPKTSKAPLVSSRKRKGLRITELAIVLTVVGLLFGGLIRGSQLIRQSKMKRQAEQLSRLAGLCKNYFDKFGRLPGDQDSDGKFDKNRRVWEDLESDDLTSRPLRNPYGGNYVFKYGSFRGQRGNYVRTTVPAPVGSFVDTVLDDGKYKTGMIRSSNTYSAKGNLQIVFFISLK